ncbi:VOC family protein [Actinomycetospora endophytica]|uniref:VOC family protein n=1 Tax=Actinomycetospora endophytica TaxID=2291215 RepID=A0ABS8PI01_9PSEU|nr:VOC family protein [Actinomycetospora endophytica]MCD2197886.1 VOC family protein [Actinomycetospora endophytica]
MTVELNHTIVPSHDQKAAAKDLAEMLGLEAKTNGHFDVVQVPNGISLDFMDVDEVPKFPMHLAFLVSEDTFDEVFGRIQDRDLPYWADPMRTRPNQLSAYNGGRGLYWDSPDGHNLEILTRAS